MSFHSTIQGGPRILKYFMTDIHGDYKAMEVLLNHVNIDFSQDQLVFGGDMINRGKESGAVIRYIKHLMGQNPASVHAVIGNHEQMMDDYFNKGDRMWLSHGGYDTLASFEKSFTDISDRLEHIDWSVTLPLIYEDDEFIYTHAGLNPYRLLCDQDRDEILWMSESEFYSYPRDLLLKATNGKPIVHGHTPIELIYFDGARLNCDLGSNTYSIIEERALGLVNLSVMEYYSYNSFKKKITKKRIGRL